jgi:hypothetical protein
MSRVTILFLVVLLPPGFSFASEEGPPSVSEPAEEGSGWNYHLSIIEELRSRFAGEVAPTEGGLIGGAEKQADYDLRLQIDSSLFSPGESFSADFSGALWWDINGSKEEDAGPAFGSLFDYRNPWIEVYRLSCDLSPHRSFFLRAGRQQAEHGKIVTFDGLTAEWEATGSLSFFILGGRSVHFFESGAGLFEDWLGSGGIFWRVDRSWRLEMDYRLQLEDTAGANLSSPQGVLDHSVGFAAWYRRGLITQAKFWFRTLDDQLAEIGLRGSYFWPHLDAGVNYLLFGQPAILRQINENEDPFFAILGESLPHLRWRLEAWKGWQTAWSHISLHLGSDGRRLFENRREGPFNRETSRFYSLLVFDDFLLPGFYLAGSGELHFALERGRMDSDLIFTAGGFLGYRCLQERCRVEVGTAYQRYRLDYYRDLREVENSRLVYASARARLVKWLDLRLRYEFESADRYFHTVSLMLLQTW